MKIYLGTDHPIQYLLALKAIKFDRIFASQGRIYGASAGGVF